jgi:hypothetical protein
VSVFRLVLLRIRRRSAVAGRTVLALGRLFALEMHATLASMLIYCVALALLALIGIEAVSSRGVIASAPHWAQSGASGLRGTGGF